MIINYWRLIATGLWIFCVNLIKADFGDKAHIQDTAHLKQHLEHQIDVGAKEQWDDIENRFHYFSISDLNKDGLVDGLEVSKAISHAHNEDIAGEHNSKIWSDEELESAVDKVLKEVDFNNDGRIDYSEYSKQMDL
uniref:EF-hand domain-containing protein n=1 Tax=Ditylenchus dipsaci TaxID=166011 RepID=A0A915E4K8_9BILA